jgi:hypothetical protein
LSFYILVKTLGAKTMQDMRNIGTNYWPYEPGSHFCLFSLFLFSSFCFCFCFFFPP